MIPLTIAYITARKESKIEWFLDSLRQQGGFTENISVIIVDLYGNTKPIVEARPQDHAFITVVAPKPCVWQGPHRLTKQDWFAASNARNTALCMTRTSHIAYVDDLSVLTPGWLNAAMDAKDYIACGAYQKVKSLSVENGEVKSFSPFPEGEDGRMKRVSRNVSPCGGNWAYGCSLAGPVDAFISVNGWPEDLCDGLGFEDVCMGIALERAGRHMKYDRRMKTLESEEGHHQEVALRREDWHKEGNDFVVGGNGKDDKSHAALAIARNSRYFPNSFGDGGIASLRRRILAGDPWPIRTTPDRDWFTGKLLAEL